MIAPQVLKAASMIQSKSWQFALAYELKLKLLGDLGRLTPLYKIAKDNIGCRSLIFGLEKYKHIMFNQDGVGYRLGTLLLSSLETKEMKIRRVCGVTERLLKSFLDPAIATEHWQCVTTKMSESVPRYGKQTQSIFRQYWDGEDEGVLPILADSLAELDGADFEADHIRSGRHSPACPVLQRLLTRK